MFVRASELYPEGTDAWATCISLVWSQLTTQAAANESKPAWLAQDALRLAYSEQCVDLIPGNVEAWEMRGAVCVGGCPTWLDWAPIQPRSRELVIESVFAYKRAARCLARAGSSPDDYRYQVALRKEAYAKELLTGPPPPQFLAALDGELGLVEEYLRNGVDVDKRDLGMCTMLYYATEEGRLAVVEALIAHRANLNLQCDTGYTPLLASVVNGHTDVFNALMRAGADVNLGDYDNMSPVSYAAQDAKLAML
eukprot:6869547-Prymnesium_polylepis.1